LPGAGRTSTAIERIFHPRMKPARGVHVEHGNLNSSNMRPVVRLLLPLLGCAAPATTLYAQGFGLGIKGGPVFSTTRSEVQHATLLPNATFGVHVPISAAQRLEVQPELLVTAMGATYHEPDGGRYAVRTLYLQVPVSAKLFLTNAFNVQGGLQLGKLLSAQRQTDDGGQAITERYNNMDAGLNGGLGLDFRSGVDLTLRYYGGMTPVLANDQRIFPRHRAVQLTAGYRMVRFGPLNTTRRRR